MSSVALRNLHDALSMLPAETGRAGARNARADAQLGIKELEALRNVDMVSPEVGQVAEPLVQMYQGQITTGDALRLEQRTRFDGPSVRAAIGRFLSVDRTRAGGSPEQLQKEARLHQVLKGLDLAVTHIRQQALIARAD